MPSQTASKRLSSEAFADDDEKYKKKSCCVQFDDKIEEVVVLSDDGLSIINDGEHAGDEEDVDFVLSIGDDGDLDYTILTKNLQSPPSEDKETVASQDVLLLKNASMGKRATEPEEVESKHEEFDITRSGRNSLLRCASLSNIGSISIELAACHDLCHDPMPLITPPSSPRRIYTVNMDNGDEEEATICEWPSNLAVDIAITAASEELQLPLY